MVAYSAQDTGLGRLRVTVRHIVTYKDAVKAVAHICSNDSLPTNRSKVRRCLSLYLHRYGEQRPLDGSITSERLAQVSELVRRLFPTLT